MAVLAVQVKHPLAKCLSTYIFKEAVSPKHREFLNSQWSCAGFTFWLETTKLTHFGGVLGKGRYWWITYLGWDGVIGQLECFAFRVGCQPARTGQVGDENCVAAPERWAEYKNHQNFSRSLNNPPSLNRSPIAGRLQVRRHCAWKRAACIRLWICSGKLTKNGEGTKIPRPGFAWSFLPWIQNYKAMQWLLGQKIHLHSVIYQVQIFGVFFNTIQCCI